MPNLDIHITIHAPELAAALTKLADALSAVPVVSAAANPATTSVKKPTVSVSSTAPATPTPAPVPANPNASAAPATPPTQTTQPAPTAAPAPYTFPQLQQAAGVLVQAGRQQELCNLLNQKYKVQALTQLTEAQYGAFATDLRTLGVNI